MSYGLVSEGPSGFMKAFSSTNYLQGSKDFLMSNSIVAKFAFLMLILIVFIILIRFGVSFISWVFSPSKNPILIDGMINAKQHYQYNQDPSVSGSKPILRSINLEQGLEFTWSVWLHIEDFVYKQNEYKHVFHKGNMNINHNDMPIGLNKPNNAPGLYITPNTNNLLVIMNTFDKINEEVIVEDIPLNKWVNVIIRVTNQTQLDVYINGILTKRHILSGVPKQNYGDVFVTANGGFDGKLSKLQYFNKALGTSAIQKIVTDGPDLTEKSKNLLDSNPRYLSTRWFFGKNYSL